MKKKQQVPRPFPIPGILFHKAGQIKFDRFSIIAAQLILDTNRQRDDEEVLRRAFRVSNEQSQIKQLLTGK